jgi:hypothetical protein
MPTILRSLGGRPFGRTDYVRSYGEEEYVDKIDEDGEAKQSSLHEEYIKKGQYDEEA